MQTLQTETLPIVIPLHTWREDHDIIGKSINFDEAYLFYVCGAKMREHGLQTIADLAGRGYELINFLQEDYE